MKLDIHILRSFLKTILKVTLEFCFKEIEKKIETESIKRLFFTNYNRSKFLTLKKLLNHFLCEQVKLHFNETEA